MAYRRLESGHEYRGIVWTSWHTAEAVKRLQANLLFLGIADARIYTSKTDLPADWPFIKAQESPHNLLRTIWIEFGWLGPDVDLDLDAPGWDKGWILADLWDREDEAAFPVVPPPQPLPPPGRALAHNQGFGLPARRRY